MLELSGVAMSFGGFYALREVDLRVAPGERHAVIGPNGAGKSTLFNVITGHLRPTRGSVAFEGRPITGMKPHALVKRGLGRSFQRVNVFPKLTVFDNIQAALIAHDGRAFDLLSLGGPLHGEAAHELAASVGLGDETDRVAGTLSYGKQKQLELALSLAGAPRLLLLDEPTAGMSARETAEILELIGRLADARDLTLLFTEHDMAFVFGLATTVTVLHNGTPIATGAPEAVRDDPEVKRVYLGGHDAAA